MFKHFWVGIWFLLLTPAMDSFSQGRVGGPVWLEKAVFYQVYPQTFKDSDGDGIGDLNGIRQKLDYLRSLGIDAIWMNPIFKSPFRDAGYDVEDYYSIAPRYGTEEDLKRLLDEAHAKGMKVVLDLVAGHTSDQHPWFKASQQKKRNAYSDRYVWTETTGQKPENYVSRSFDRNGNYLKNFFSFQPALNFGFAAPAQSWEQPVDAEGPRLMRQELKKIIAYWMDKGVDGFRVDMASSLIKNDPGFTETQKLWREMRNWFEAKYPEGVLIAEWSNPKQSVDAGFMIDFMMHFNVPGYPSMFFNSEGVFPRDTCYFDARGIGNPFEFIHHYMDQVKGVGNRGYVSIPTANHDINRPHAGSRNTPEQLKVLMTFLLTLKGIPFIYYGDEIGMRYVPALPDKEGSVLEIPGTQNRAGSRTPMQWDNTKNAGFSEADSIYLPIDSKHFYPNVQGQEKNPGSLLNYTRHLINLRKLYPALGNTGQIQFLNKGSETYPLVYERSLESQRLIIVINPSGRDAEFVIKGYDGFEFEEIITDKARIMSDTKDSIIYVGTFGYGIFLIK